MAIMSFERGLRESAAEEFSDGDLAARRMVAMKLLNVKVERVRDRKGPVQAVAKQTQTTPFLRNVKSGVGIMNGRSLTAYPGSAPIFTPGKEPLPPGFSEEDRAQLAQQQKWEGYAAMAMESCAVKTVLAGGAGFGIGAFFSLMSASFAYEDPLLRQQTQAGMKAHQKAREVMKEMGRGMWSSGKGFGKVGALFAVSSGFLAGGVLARNSGPKAAFGGGLAFAAFSALLTWHSFEEKHRSELV
ncbi:Mitochondrial import inner membrane translocase [Salix suchowensis]|nr:Mitochondrial import inner membrane translocase [Salix suchowensis]